MSVVHKVASKSRDDPIPSQYGLCLVGLGEDMRKMITDLVPEAHTLIFPAPGSSPNEIDAACAQFQQRLMSYYNERKHKVKRFVIVTCGLGEVLVKQALVTAARTPDYQEVAVIISHLLIFFPPPGPSDQSSWGDTFIGDAARTPISTSNLWLRESLTHSESISISFNSIDRNYHITNIIYPVRSQGARLNRQVAVESNKITIQLERSVVTGEIWDNMNNLIRLYNCLFPMTRLELFYEVSDYFACLEKIKWSCIEDQQSGCPVPIETEAKEKLIRHLGLRRRESKGYPTLVCLFGPLGCGKTSFLRNFPHGLGAYKDVITVRFEKQDFQKASPSISDILKSLSRQVLRQVPSTFSRINSYYQFLRDHDVWSEQLLWMLVRRLLEGFQYKLVLLVDDIDNWFPEFKTLFEKLENFRQSSPFVLHFIYTATGEGPRLKSGTTLKIDLAKKATRQEIAQKLTKRLLGIQLESNSTAEAIDLTIQTTSESCLTSYLYAKQVSRLRTVRAPSVLREMLPDLPRLRDEIYQAELNMLAGANRNVLKWCWNCLSWLVQAARPMTVSELSVAVALNQMGPKITKSGIQDHISVRMWEDLDQHLGLFVCREGSRLAMVHTTAKDYIHSHSSSIPKGHGISSHASIAILCLEYLETVIAECNEAEAHEHPEYGFVQYSVEYWPRHYQLARDDDPVNHPDLDDRVIRFISNQQLCNSWLKIFQTTASRLVSVQSMEGDALVVLCGLGQVELVSRILQEEARPISEDLLQRSLDTAIKNGQSTVIQILLEAGAGARSELLLSFAAERDMIDVVTNLLAPEVTFKEPGSLKSALATAASHGSLKAATKLCSHCTDPEMLAQIQLSAVDYAAAGGHEPILSFLLDQLDGYNDGRNSNHVGFSEDEIPGENMELDTSPIQYVLALQKAAEFGHNDIVQSLLDAGTKATGLALEIASKQQNIALVRLLNKSLISQNRMDVYTNALHFAAERGDVHIVGELLDYGVDPDSRDGAKRSPLHMAAKQGHADVVQLLLHRGAKRDAQDDHGVMPCHLAALNGHIQTYRALQQEPKVREDNLLVTYAAKGGHHLMVKYLLSLKLGSINTKQNMRSAVVEAAYYGYLSIVRVLREAGFSLNSEEGTTSPLHEAASGGYADVVSYLLTKGAKVDPRDEARRTPLHFSMVNPEVVKMLLEKGADPNAKDENRKTALHSAAGWTSEGQAEDCVRMLIRKGARVNDQDKNMAMPIHHAADRGWVGAVTALLENGACQTQTNKFVQTPFNIAVEKNHFGVARLLLLKGADINWAGGITPLMQASHGGLTEMVSFLLENGADCNSTANAYWTLGTHKGSTALHWASGKGFVGIMETLLMHKAEPNIKNKTGMTPLHWAASNGHAQAVQVLLKNGADTSIQNQWGKTALQIAIGAALACFD